MRRLSGAALSIRQLLGLGFTQGSFPPPGSISGDVFTKGAGGEPAALPGAQIVLRGLGTEETESDEQGAFSIDGLPPGTYQIGVNAPSLYTAVPAEVSAATSSSVPNVAAVISTTLPQLIRLKAMDCAFSRKVHHA